MGSGPFLLVRLSAGCKVPVVSCCSLGPKVPSERTGQWSHLKVLFILPLSLNRVVVLSFTCRLIGTIAHHLDVKWSPYLVVDSAPVETLEKETA